MQLGQGCRTRTPWWCWLILILGAAATLPGAALIGAAGEQSAVPSEERRANPDSAGPGVEAQDSSEQSDPRPTEGRQSTPEEIITVRVANDPSALRPGETIDLVLFERSQASDAAPDPRVVLKNAACAVDPPTFDAIVRALPDTAKRIHPFVAEVSRKNIQVSVELIVDGLGECRFYPNVGQARHLRQHYKCTVQSDKTTRSDWPLPFARTEQSHDVVHIDHDELISADRAHEVLYLGIVQEASRDRARGDDVRNGGPIDAVQDDSVEPAIFDKKAYEIRIATSAERLKAAMPTGRLMFFRRETEHRNSARDRLFTSAGQEGAPQPPVAEAAGATEKADDERTKADRAHAPDADKQVNRRFTKLREVAPNELITLTYAVADLVVPIQHLQVAVSDGSSAAASKKGQLPADASGEHGADPTIQDNFTALIELIQDCVAPDKWEQRSGPGSMIPYRTTLSLVVRQTKAVHDQIAELLGQLRRLSDLQVALRVELFTTSGTESLTPLKLEADPLNSKEGASLLDETQVQGFRELIGTMEKGNAAAVMRGPKLMLLNGQGAELALRRRLLAQGTAAMPTLHLVPTISADRTAIRLQVAVGAKQPLDALARNHAYVIKQGQSLLADMTDELSPNQFGGILEAHAGAIRRLHRFDMLPRAEAGTIRREHKDAQAERVLLLITPQICVVEEEVEKRPGDIKSNDAKIP